MQPMTSTIEVNAPVEKVFDLFTDKNRFLEWKIGFKSHKHLSGTQSGVGAVSQLTYKRFVMIETIKQKDKPHLYITSFEYLQNGKTMMEHEAVNKFTSLAENHTLVEVISNVTKVNGFFNRIFVKLMAKAGQKQFRDQLQLFKKMAER
jgi:uncharacterized membrane protein